MSEFSKLHESFNDLDKDNINQVVAFQQNLFKSLEITEDLDEVEELKYFIEICDSILNAPADSSDIDDEENEPQ